MAFEGFGQFHAQEKIWQHVFSSDHQQLETMLSYPIGDKTAFSKKLHGKVAWTYERDAFLRYSTDAAAYQEVWLKKLPSHPDYKALFLEFCHSVPDRTEKKLDRYLPLARQVKAYLTELTALMDEGSDPEAAAAGLYVLVGFFLQNEKTMKPDRRLYLPPQQYDPVAKQQAQQIGAPEKAPPVVTLHDGVLQAPDLQLQFDLFAHVQAQLGGKALMLEETADVPPAITPSIVRRQPVTVLRSFEIAEVPGYNTHAFLFDMQARSVNAACSCHLSLQKLSRTTRQEGGLQIHTYQLNHRCMSAGFGCCGLIVSTRKDSADCRVHTFCLHGEGKGDCFEGITISAVTEGFAVVEVDEDGYLADRSMEQMLQLRGIAPAEAGTGAPRKAISRTMEPEYADFLALDWANLDVIPKFTVRDPVTGQRCMGMTVNCPGKVLVLKPDCSQLRSDMLAVCGHLYGMYGCAVDEMEANLIMVKGIWKQEDPQMEFQLGAYIRSKGMTGPAQENLRRAAQKGIAGAMFELAELLGDTEESRLLIRRLWEQGYRTYGSGISIDLWKERNG